MGASTRALPTRATVHDGHSRGPDRWLSRDSRSCFAIHRPSCNIPRAHAAHTAGTRAAARPGGSRPIRSRMADSLVKSRFAPPISRVCSNFRSVPGPCPVRAHPRFRFSVREILFCSVEGAIFFLFPLFFFLPRRSSARQLRRVTLTVRNPRVAFVVDRSRKLGVVQRHMVLRRICFLWHIHAFERERKLLDKIWIRLTYQAGM